MELIVKVMCLNEIPKAEGLDIQRGLKYQEIVQIRSLSISTSSHML